MTTRSFLLLFLFAFCGSTSCLFAEGLPAAEKTKIEALLSHVAGLSEAKFIRNGKEYDAPSAAKFLRGKWEANEKSIHSAESFIAVAATKSSTSGKPYLIRLQGQSASPCGEYLSAQLKKMGEGPADR